MKRVLLHICCGVCAFGSIEHLKKEGYYIEGFFYNPNIYPPQEYSKRLQALGAVKDVLGIAIEEGRYNDDEWFSLCKDYADEQEGGVRCMRCYEMRLSETYRKMQDKKFDYFTTTLTISPHKNSSDIFDIGKAIDAQRFLVIDFKKQDGFKRTQELSKKYNVYHQDYCGCIYSQRNRRQMTEDR